MRLPPPLFPCLMLTALVVGIWLTRSRQARLPLSQWQRFGIALGAFCGGMLGSKIPFAVFDPSGPWCAQAWLADGKTILFGLVGGYLGVEFAKFWLDIKVKTGDSFAVPVAVSIGIGRWGCFVAGCCYGQPTTLPWGVAFGDGVRRHPTQIYEFLFHWTAALILIGLERANLFPRQRFKLYLLSYCLFRVCTEFIRPEPILAAGLTAYQWTALALMPVIGMLWWHDARTTAPGPAS